MEVPPGFVRITSKEIVESLDQLCDVEYDYVRRRLDILIRIINSGHGVTEQLIGSNMEQFYSLVGKCQTALTVISQFKGDQLADEFASAMTELQQRYESQIFQLYGLMSLAHNRCLDNLSRGQEDDSKEVMDMLNLIRGKLDLTFSISDEARIALKEYRLKRSQLRESIHIH